MALNRDDVLRKLDVVRYLTDVEGWDLKEESPGQYKALCIFHQDADPSLSVSEKGLYWCFVCHSKGTVFDLYMKIHQVEFVEALRALAELAGGVAGPEVEEMSEEHVVQWYRTLMADAKRLEFLHEKRGLTDATITKWSLGWDGYRYTIPVRDADGVLINVRRYKPNAKKTERKMLNTAGHGKLALFNVQALAAATEVLILEGELDVVLADQEEIVAVTPTGGAGTWQAEWGPRFAGKVVRLCQDYDTAGQKGNDDIGALLAPYAAEVLAVKWPSGTPEKTDITDYLVAQDHPRTEFLELLAAAPVWAPREASAMPDFELTDIGNGQRFVLAHGTDLRYVDVWKRWFRWAESHWDHDQIRGIEATAQKLLLDLTNGTDPVVDKDLYLHLQKSQHETRVKAMVSLARSNAPIATRTDAFDADQWLLACANGTLDLRTGTLRESKRDDLITKAVDVAYDPAAKSAAWELLLDVVTGGDVDLRAFLQRAIGYSLTGDVSEEKLFFVWGPTRTGKSTFLEAIRRALGKYAATAQFNTFLDQKNGAGEMRGEIARLRGVRFVTSIEVEEGKKLAEGLIKQLTGGDTINARFLYAEQFEFAFNAKLWLAANHKPRISDDDDAIWRRILLVPFDQTIANPDPAIKEELLDVARSGAAILAWAVAGCVAWQREGLGQPAKIAAATAAYRVEQDPIADWFDEYCVEIPGARTNTGDFYSSYSAWCRNNGWRFVLKAKGLTNRLKERGFKTEETKRGQHVFVDLALKIQRASAEEERF